ncbi:LOW QUALITY PROTEIN: laminin subunit beta-4 [Erethizon dorsatum]
MTAQMSADIATLPVLTPRPECDPAASDGQTTQTGGSVTQDECDNGACRPAPDSLLVGHISQLTVSSTCGLNGAQTYCILSCLEGEQKCFMCDSRFPYNLCTQPNSHTTENNTSFEPDRENKWWQSENGIDHVSIRLDLELFQFSHLILAFKYFQPAAMLVEHSMDYGHTWKALKYFAKGCAASFPDITPGQAQEVGDLVCDSRYSDIQPSTGGKVLKVLDPSFDIESPYSPYIQDLVTLTNLRTNFTKLHTLGDTLLGSGQNNPLDKYYYALYEMVVGSSLFCNSHTSECGPLQKVRGDFFSPLEMQVEKAYSLAREDVTLSPKLLAANAALRNGLGNEQARLCIIGVFNRNIQDAQDPRRIASLGTPRKPNSTKVQETLVVTSAYQHACPPSRSHECYFSIYLDTLTCECDSDGTMSNGICVCPSDPASGIVSQCLCKDNVQGAKCDQKANNCGLSASGPRGCQPCDRVPLGSLPLSACDVDTGQCLCRTTLQGMHCTFSPHADNPPVPSTQVLEVEETYPWRLDPGARGVIAMGVLPVTVMLNNEDSLELSEQENDGRRNVFGVLANLAEEKSELERKRSGKIFTFLLVTFDQTPPVHIVFEPVPGNLVTWTGPGFAKVLPGASLRFAVDNIPFPTDFTVAVLATEFSEAKVGVPCVKDQSVADWAVQIMANPRGSGYRTRKTPQPKPPTFALPVAARVVLLPTPICLELGRQHSTDVYFSQSLEGGSHTHSHILIQKLGLIPQTKSLEDFCSKQAMAEDQLHNCVETAWEAGSQELPGACERLIASIWAKLRDTSKCHPQGMVRSSCSQLGGQCQCKPHVAGCCCDRCSAGCYGLGHHGCHSCDCHPQGSKNIVCDQITSQYPCHGEVAAHCEQCLAGYFGFPNCHPFCNRFAELCNPETGSCFKCGGFTTRRNCERCIDGYNPSLGQSCPPCLCLDVPSINQYFAHLCYQNPWSSDVICSCLQGYTRIQCGECSPGFYGDPQVSGAPCQPCVCNHNIDVTDPESYSQVTGCLRCLHNTQGPNCQLCTPGHFGSTLNQTCQSCSCQPPGASPVDGPPAGGACLCDLVTVACPCLPNVTDLACDHRDDGYWNLVPGRGCQPCDCDPRTPQSSHRQCPKLGCGGKRCSECKENYSADPLGCMPSDCHREGTQKPLFDPDTGVCHCRDSVSSQRCDRCAQGHGQEFPTCLQGHLCFDQRDHIASSLSEAVQGLIRLAANVKVSCEAGSKGLEESISDITRILENLVFSSRELLKVEDYHDSVRKQNVQLSEQLKAVYEFQDLQETTIRLRNADLFLEQLREEMNFQSSALNTSIVGERENALFLHGVWPPPWCIPSVREDQGACRAAPRLWGRSDPRKELLPEAQEAESAIQNNQARGLKSQIKTNLSKLAEVSKNNATQLSEKLENMKNQSDEEEKMNLFIKKAKNFLLEEIVPPEDIEKAANRVLDICLPITSQNLTHELEEMQKLRQLCENYRTERNWLNKKLVELKKQYVLQHETSATGLTKETLGRVKQLKDAAEKSAEETEDKLKRRAAMSYARVFLSPHETAPVNRVCSEASSDFAPRSSLAWMRSSAHISLVFTHLEKTIEDLNLNRQEKANQLKQLEDQATSIKNEVIEQEDKYATHYS